MADNNYPDYPNRDVYLRPPKAEPNASITMCIDGRSVTVACTVGPTIIEVIDDLVTPALLGLLFSREVIESGYAQASEDYRSTTEAKDD